MDKGKESCEDFDHNFDQNAVFLEKNGRRGRHRHLSIGSD